MAERAHTFLYRMKLLFIREFEQRDEDAVVALWRACGLVKPQNDPVMDIARKREVDPDLFLVGEFSGAIAASVMGGYEGHRGWINYLVVLLKYQGKGFGSEIMEAIENCLLRIPGARATITLSAWANGLCRMTRIDGV